MVFILKEPQTKSKGILVFTAKEKQILNSGLPGVNTCLKRLRQKYVVGLYWGFYEANVPDWPFTDFYLAPHGSIDRVPDAKLPQIPVSGRNFTPAAFAVPPKNQEKFWDVLTVGRPAKWKRFDEFLKAVRIMVDKRPETTALIVCSVPDNADPKKYDLTLPQQFDRLFSEAEREKITLLWLTQRGDAYPMLPNTMAHFFKQSRLFALFSEYEGAARVVSEALLCGLPVVLRKGMRGGTADFVDDKNACQFDTTEQAAQQMLSILDGKKKTKVNAQGLAEKMSETHTVPWLEGELKKVFKMLKEPWKGSIKTENLGRHLPAHIITLPRHLRSPVTDDLNSSAAFLEYAHLYLGEKKPSVLNLLLNKLMWPLQSRWRKYVYYAGRAVLKVKKLLK